MKSVASARRRLLTAAAAAAAILAGAAGRLSGVCGPFLDVAPDVFCPFVLEVFTVGITTGTTATTYDPTSPVTRVQMAAFLSRSVDGALTRSSRAAALNQFWTTQNATVLGLTTVGGGPTAIRSDGQDLWVANNTNGTVHRIRASDGKLLETWTGAYSADAVLVAMGQVLVAGNDSTELYRIDPSRPAGSVTTVATNLGLYSYGMAYDGQRVWTANYDSVSIVTPAAATPWTVTTVTAGFVSPADALYDGTNIWISDEAAGALRRLDSAGSILQTVTIGSAIVSPAFDGTNIWVPVIGSGSVAVVRASTGAILRTLTGNGLFSPFSAAFDGRRILVTDYSAGGVFLWKAADTTFLGFFPVGAPPEPYGACSDGANFFLTMSASGRVARF